MNALAGVLFKFDFRMECKYSKRTTQWYVVKVFEPKAYTYIPELLRNVFMKKESSKASVSQKVGIPSDEPRQIVPNIAAIPPPSVQSLKEPSNLGFRNQGCAM